MDLYQSLVTVNPVTLIAQICNLFIQLLIVKIFFLDKIKAVLDKRRETADKQIADAEAAKSEAAAIKQTYEENMRQAKTKADDMILSAQKTAAQRSEEIISQAQKQAAQIKTKADADIAQQRKKAVNDAKNEIGSIAMEIASKVVEREIDAKDHKALIDEFINNVGEAS